VKILTKNFLDLRNNPGGLLNVAIDISEEFLPEGQIIVETKSRNPSQNSVEKSKNSKGEFINWPIVVLINEGSASGSEILAGALKDNKRGIIIGTQSFGKGSVQSVIPLPDGAGLKLTTSKYFTPSDISIHGVGITPDIIVEYDSDGAVEDKEKEDKAEKIFDDVENGDKELDEAALKEQKTKKRLLADDQVKSAISVLKGIKVYQK